MGRKPAGRRGRVRYMEEKELSCKKGYTILIWGITAVFTGLYLSLAFSHNVWTDEAFSLQLLRGNVRDIIIGTANDVHPPFYYLYAKLFKVIFGDSFLVQKIAVIIPMAAVLVVGATLVPQIQSLP